MAGGDLNDWRLELSGGLFIHMSGTSVGRSQRWTHVGLLTRSSVPGLSLVTELQEKKHPKRSNLEGEHY